MGIVYAFVLYQDAIQRKQGERDYLLLRAQLERGDLQTHWESEAEEEVLYFVSLASQALFRVGQHYPAERERILPQLRGFAEWVTDRRRFPNWNRRSRWPEEAFFLAHAGIILGHYQLMSKDETHAADWRAVADFTHRALRAARYKNLVSRIDDNLMRPADNAALLYMLSGYDRYHATEYLSAVGEKWLNYLAEELEYGNSHLPCSAFTPTNICRLDPTASALGLGLGYLAAAGYDDRQQLYSEWMHYFKSPTLNPIGLETRSTPITDAEDHFCDAGSFPLACEAHVDDIAFWLAAEFGGHYTYARLLSKRVIARGRATNNVGGLRPDKRIGPLTGVAIRVIAQFK